MSRAHCWVFVIYHALRAWLEAGFCYELIEAFRKIVGAWSCLAFTFKPEPKNEPAPLDEIL